MFQIRVPRAGLSYSDVYDWREAAHWAGGGSVFYWEDFCDLDTEEQSAIVAHFQTQRQIEAVMAQDMERKRRQAAARAARRGRR